MPFGAPLYVVPKSGCRLRRPHDAISVAELASTGVLLTSVFHGLSLGNGRRPFSDPPPALSVGTLDGGSLDEAPHAAIATTVSVLINRKAVERILNAGSNLPRTP